MKNTIQPSGTVVKRDYKKISIPVIAVILLLAVLKNCGNSTISESSGGIRANSWYTYKELDILKVQNCLVHNAGLFSNNVVSVSYYPVCRSCHTVSQSLEISSASPNYPKTKSYYCDECGANTTVKLKVEV